MLHSRPHQVVFALITVGTFAPVVVGLGMFAADGVRAVKAKLGG